MEDTMIPGRAFAGALGQTPIPRVPGNIDLTKRPVVRNPDGSISTVRSITVGFDDGTYVLPTVTDDGRVISDDEAIALFRKTGRHLGVFSDIKDADLYAQRLHEEQAKMYGGRH